MKILEVKNLCKTYGKGDTMVKALDNVSFSVEKGEFIAIVGPSGSGKSTLLHILGGVDVPTSGNVIIDKTDISQLNETALAIFRRRQIGLVYQFYNLIPILTVEENLTLPLLLDGKSRMQKQSAILLISLASSKDCSICRISFRAASNRGFQSAEPLSIIRHFCLQMNLPVIWTVKTAVKLSLCFAASISKAIKLLL